jgi:hypothetical protein
MATQSPSRHKREVRPRGSGREEYNIVMKRKKKGEVPATGPPPFFR